MKKLTRYLAKLACMAFVLSATVLSADDAVVTFFVTSDSHYEAVQNVERNDRNRATILRMNELSGQVWPETLGGGEIGKPFIATMSNTNR